MTKKPCDFCGQANPRKGHEKKCVERLRRAIAPKRAKQVLVDEIHQFHEALETRVSRHALPDLNETRPHVCAYCGIKAMMTDMRKKNKAKQVIVDEIHHYVDVQMKQAIKRSIPLGSEQADLISADHKEKLRKEFKAKFPAANDTCPHCQASGASISHQAGCPNGESRSVNETYVPESAMPAIHWRSVYYIKIKEGPQAIPVGTWIVRGGIDRGDRSEADLERDGWVRADGRFAKTALEFPKTPGRVPDLYPRFQPGDAWYVEGADNMIPIYWGDHA